ncbi:hypothetical protein J5289_28560 (plasmid) [Rhizobium sp. B230/85]|uniref:ProQ/FINO family protein n=1 Tax=unclassified Rhizobium TaxID=2613769 RepID=UPI001ADA286D|nr:MULTISPECIES: ProQ/FINO family protein [unclassified Rhizobium]MBO9136642.1 hypothetical protein [Rhizobium sp. B209b/85]QXZ99770.1 hypothetical protein J5289_28560 [Rhizobium sp. B230/85]
MTENLTTDTIKPWRVSKGPIAASAYDLKKAEAINVLLASPAIVLPASEGAPILPFAIGLFETFKSRLRDDATATQLRRATAVYTHAKNYLFACAQPDSMRHDIDGQAVMAVSDEDRLSSQLRFVDILRSRKAAQADVGVQSVVASSEAGPAAEDGLQN